MKILDDSMGRKDILQNILPSLGRFFMFSGDSKTSNNTANVWSF